MHEQLERARKTLRTLHAELRIVADGRQSILRDTPMALAERMARDVEQVLADILAATAGAEMSARLLEQAAERLRSAPSVAQASSQELLGNLLGTLTHVSVERVNGQAAREKAPTA